MSTAVGETYTASTPSPEIVDATREFNDAELMDMLAGEAGLEQKAERQKTIDALVEHYGDQTFEYETADGTLRTGDVRTIIDLCPAIDSIIDCGFDRAVAWLEPHKQAAEKLVDEPEESPEDAKTNEASSKEKEESRSSKESDATAKSETPAAPKSAEATLPSQTDAPDVTTPDKTEEQTLTSNEVLPAHEPPKEPETSEVVTEAEEPEEAPAAHHVEEPTEETPVLQEVVTEAEATEIAETPLAVPDETEATDPKEEIVDLIEPLESEDLRESDEEETEAPADVIERALENEVVLSREETEPEIDIFEDVYEKIQEWQEIGETEESPEVAIVAVIVESTRLQATYESTAEGESTEPSAELNANQASVDWLTLIAYRADRAQQSLERLKSARTSEECHEAIKDVLSELMYLLKLLGYPNPEVTARQLLKEHPVDSLIELLAQLQKAAEATLDYLPQPAVTRRSLTPKGHLHLGKLVTQLLVTLFPKRETAKAL